MVAITAVCLVLLTALFARAWSKRIRLEEGMLLVSELKPAYLEYQRKTRWRLLPLVW